MPREAGAATSDADEDEVDIDELGLFLPVRDLAAFFLRVGAIEPNALTTAGNAERTTAAIGLRDRGPGLVSMPTRREAGGTKAVARLG